MIGLDTNVLVRFFVADVLPGRNEIGIGRRSFGVLAHDMLRGPLAPHQALKQ